ncbi:hypothetical protein N0V95_008662 [Ascochyta clinopodiicola]|nr:hypothetical protein N0V95_008662 [Ascochyta clinopodiicola]
MPSNTETTGESVAYINASVYTVNKSDPWASAFIVSQDGFFTHVGSTEEILTEAKKSHFVIVDLQERFTMPGIHDAHMHLLFSGLGLTSSAVIGMDATYLNIAEKAFLMVSRIANTWTKSFQTSLWSCQRAQGTLCFSTQQRWFRLDTTLTTSQMRMAPNISEDLMAVLLVNSQKVQWRKLH